MSKRKSSGPSNDCHFMEKYSSFDNLPKEIVAEIVFRLPPESLIRLKSLNKSWYFVILCLIGDPDFTAKHQRHAEENPVILRLNESPCLETKTGLSKSKSKLRPQTLWPMLISRLVDNGNIHCVTKNIDISHLPTSLTRGTSYVKVCHCNGIILYTKGCMRIFTLYSPLTGKFETFNTKPFYGGFQICAMGIGCDLGGNNFKVVRVLKSMRAQIFSPRTSESWREIKMSVQDRSYRNVYGHVYSKGHCFWVAEDRYRTVLCFDVCEEAFHEILLPNEVDASNGIFRLATVDDSVCLISYPNKEPIDVWVMDINGVFSWRKWLRIEHFKGFRSPVTFWSSDELLMEAENDEMVSYDIRTKKLTRVSPKLKLGYFFYFGIYVKSLVSVKWDL